MAEDRPKQGSSPTCPEGPRRPSRRSASAAFSTPAIRLVEPDDGPAIHALLTTCIPDVLADRDRWLARWRWQYWDNPYRHGRPVGYVVADGKRILGHLGAVYMPLHVGDREVTGAVGADYAMSEEAAARGGAFAALDLAQRLFSECAGCVVMATTANEKTGAVFGRFGCKSVEWTREFWRASTSLRQQFRTCCGGRSRLTRRVFNSRMGSLFTRVLVAAYQAVGRTVPIPISRNCVLETTVPQLARDLGHLWETVRAAELASSGKRPAGAGKRLRVNRSQTFLDWRYGRHPERDHIRVLVLRNSGGRPLGAAIVFREHRPDRHVVYVEDLLVLPDRPDAARTLLCAALHLAHHGGAEHLVTSPGHRSIRPLLWELGFESRARNAPAVAIGVAAPQNQSDVPHLSELHEDELEFWHGMMF